MVEDDTINLILYGCKLAKDLEVSLPDMANQPTLVSKSCKDIITVFYTAKQWIDRRSPDSARRCFSPLYFDKQQVQPLTWKQLLRTGLRSSILLPQSTYMAGTSSGSGSAGALMERQDAGNDITVASAIPWFPTTDVSQEMATSTPSRRQRRRNNGEDRWTVKISAPRIGNMEIPPDDLYTWRKYGQKEILGSKFPRGYFRCTYRKLYQCPAKKQVQRLDNDPSTFEVTYRHLHTCHMSSTAPSVPPPSLPQDMTHVITDVPSQPPLTSTSGSSRAWMPIAFDVCGAGFTRSMNVGGNTPGPSASVETKSQFSLHNHRAGHSSSTEFVFPHMEERWKGREHK